jgi:hypothetical protein
MFVKLTYYDKGTPTLVNLDNVNTVYPVYDTSRGRVSTKIQFKDGEFMNVEESIGDIQKIEQEAKLGIYQDTSYDTASVEELLKNSFNRQVASRPREKNYNTREFHNRP